MVINKPDHLYNVLNDTIHFKYALSMKDFILIDGSIVVEFFTTWGCLVPALL